MPAINEIKLRKGTGGQWSEANPVLSEGEPGFDTTNKVFKIGDGVSPWSSLGMISGNDSLSSQTYNVSQLQSTFTVTDGYIVGSLHVFYNGVKLIENADFAATNGTTFTLTTPASAGSVVECMNISTRKFSGVQGVQGIQGIQGTTPNNDVVIASPLQITSNQNDYTLPENTDIIRLSSDAVRTITGFVANPGSVITIYNIGSFDIRIDHEDTASIASNRIISATGSDLIIAPNDNITIVYDSTSSRWRTSGVVKTTFTSQAAVYEFFRNSAPAAATGSLGSWTWTLPATAKVIELVVISGGGGGGSGMRGAAGTTRSGGGGGGCSSIANFVVSVASLPTLTANITVGSGGAGGASVTADNTNGNTGVSGSASNVDFGIYRFTVGGGRAQPSGATSASAPGALNSGASNAPYQFFGEAGQSGGVGTAGTNGTTSVNRPNQLASGAGGGGINTSNTAFAGGSGGLSGFSNYGGSTTASAATAGAAGGGNGASATFAALPMTAGNSGAGGGGNASGIGGQGGNGAIGGGGGGGGASVNGFNSGAGGNGGDGYVRITVWF